MIEDIPSFINDVSARIDSIAQTPTESGVKKGVILNKEIKKDFIVFTVDFDGIIVERTWLLGKETSGKFIDKIIFKK